MDNLWLPEGHVWDLHIEQHSIASNLSFTDGGWKLVWHTTESPWNSYDAIDGYFRGAARGKAPHFLIGGKPGADHPYVAQYVPLNESSFAMQNDASDGRDTNRAHCIQVEICGSAANMGDFGRYRALANLFTLIDHRQHIENWTHDSGYGVEPHRYSDYEFEVVRGMVGHNMAADNNHTDPGKNFRWGTLQNLIRDCPDGGWDL
jgi:N-acetyl-anhydromuramyl-L-alanine amidase AmpD